MEENTKGSATKMEVLYNEVVVGKLLRNNVLMVTANFIKEIKYIQVAPIFSPSDATLITDGANINIGAQSTQEFFEFALPLNMYLDIVTVYDKDAGKYKTTATIRQNTPTEFPSSN